MGCVGRRVLFVFQVSGQLHFAQRQQIRCFAATSRLALGRGGPQRQYLEWGATRLTYCLWRAHGATGTRLATDVCQLVLAFHGVLEGPAFKPGCGLHVLLGDKAVWEGD